MSKSSSFILFVVVTTLSGYIWAGDSDAPENPEYEADSTPTKESHVAEQTIAPITSWMEQKIHESDLVESSAYQRKKVDTNKKHSLRWAIEKAQALYPGTVLGAKKRKAEDGALVYSIKMISPEGVVKTLDVLAADKNAKEENPKEKSDESTDR